MAAFGDLEPHHGRGGIGRKGSTMPLNEIGASA
jgi:hypothetical protein